MNRTLTRARHLLTNTLMAVGIALALPLVAQAEPISLFVPFDGAGNVSVFSATSGGWVGSIDQTPPPVVSNPLSLVSVVTFDLDPVAQTLSGMFEFSTTDLMSTLYGQVSGSYFTADILNAGGQFSLDYTILGGTGMFTDASGFGLAFLNYDPAGTFNNYTESGLLNIAVPEPGTLVLAGIGAALLAVSRRKALPVN